MKFFKRCFIISCLLLTHTILARASPELRHVQGFQRLGLSIGTSLEAPYFSLDYAYHLTRAWHLQFGLGYAATQTTNLDLDQIGLQTLVAHTFWSHQSNYYTNLLGGCNLAHRWQQNIGKKRQQQNYFAISLLVGCGLECYLTNQLVLTLLLAPQIHFLNTELLDMFQLVGMLGLQFAY